MPTTTPTIVPISTKGLSLAVPLHGLPSPLSALQRDLQSSPTQSAARQNKAYAVRTASRGSAAGHQRSNGQMRNSKCGTSGTGIAVARREVTQAEPPLNCICATVNRERRYSRHARMSQSRTLDAANSDVQCCRWGRKCSTVVGVTVPPRTVTVGTRVSVANSPRSLQSPDSVDTLYHSRASRVNATAAQAALPAYSLLGSEAVPLISSRSSTPLVDMPATRGA